MQLFVEAKPHSRCPRNELDGAVVVRRAEPAGDHTEVGTPEPFGERLRELVFPVAHDRDAGRLDAVSLQLSRQKRPVQVAPIAADELAAGDDDESAGTLGHTAGRMPRGVTISVFTPPTGRRRV